MSLSEKERNEVGLQYQNDAIVRRVLDSRVICPAQAGRNGGRRLSFHWRLWNPKRVYSWEWRLRGLLWQSCCIARVSRALRASAPKIECAGIARSMGRGGSEKMSRALFADAEAKLAVCGENAKRIHAMSL